MGITVKSLDILCTITDRVFVLLYALPFFFIRYAFVEIDNVLLFISDSRCWWSITTQRYKSTTIETTSALYYVTDLSSTIVHIVGFQW